MTTPLDIRNTPQLPRYYWHPSVVYIPNGFGGHKWWMAQSPYHPGVELKPYRARWELPCIHYSEDGIHWKSVLTNPIDDLTIQQLSKEDYLSDPHLVYKEGCLELYYRLTLLKDKQVIDNKTLLYKKISLDGVNWTDRVVVADLRKKEDVAIWGKQIISQSLIWDGEKYLCWYVDGSGYQKDRGIRMTMSPDGKIWQKAEQCILKDYPDTPWHIDVQQYDGEYHMLCFGGKDRVLAHLVSTNGLTWNYRTEVLRPSHQYCDFYSERIYRSCSIRKGNDYYIFFSAATTNRSYIGLLQTTDWKTFVHVGPKWNWMYFKDISGIICEKIIRKIKKKFKI